MPQRLAPDSQAIPQGVHLIKTPLYFHVPCGLGLANATTKITVRHRVRSQRYSDHVFDIGGASRICVGKLQFHEWHVL